MADEEKYLFGPVPSRRLGLSLGVDIVPFKVCTLDCIYCQLGGTLEKTIERKEYVPVKAVLDELGKRVADGIKADFVTISGSGEPTLHAKLGQIIRGIKQITATPVAVLTNGTLFTDKSVRADCAQADVVLPSLDAGDNETFVKINRPHKDISLDRLITGLCAFRREFAGQIWLEVFFIEDFNTGTEEIAKIKSAIDRICPDKVQLNTAVRPTAEAVVQRLTKKKLEAIAEELGERCEIIADFSQRPGAERLEDKGETVLRPCVGAERATQSKMPPASSRKMKTLLSMLKRRPCSVRDICMALNVNRAEALSYISHLQKQGVINSEQRGGTTFFKVR